MELPQETTLLFNKYELGKLIGRGAFAKVYHATEIATGHSVAIKIINKNKINHITTVKREISIMSKLNHPNIVNLHEVLATKSKIYLVLEFAKGGELFNVLGKARFGEELCRKVFRQLISAVSHCHSEGIFHRDLKTDNLLLDEYGNLKVSDFGLSALTGQVWADGLLHTVCGTPSYVAPEILSKRGYDGAKSDIWSCGVVLFVLAVGRLPFNDSNLMSMYRKICKGEYTCPKWISLDMKRFLSRLMDPYPGTRITMDEIKHDPWLGYGEIRFQGNECVVKEEGKGVGDLNAFDIISFSSGLDLSGLFDDECKPLEDVERVVVKDSREKVMENVEKAVKAGNGYVRFKVKKDCAFEIQEGRYGEFVVGVEVYKLSEELVVVEASRKCGNGNMFVGDWKDKIRTMIMSRTDQRVLSC